MKSELLKRSISSLFLMSIIFLSALINDKIFLSILFINVIFSWIEWIKIIEKTRFKKIYRIIHIVVFLIIWMILFFISLPIGINVSQHHQEGFANSAPDKTNLKIKVITSFLTFCNSSKGFSKSVILVNLLLFVFLE